MLVRRRRGSQPEVQKSRFRRVRRSQQALGQRIHRHHQKICGAFRVRTRRTPRRRRHRLIHGPGHYRVSSDRRRRPLPMLPLPDSFMLTQRRLLSPYQAKGSSDVYTATCSGCNSAASPGPSVAHVQATAPAPRLLPQAPPERPLFSTPGPTREEENHRGDVSPPPLPSRPLLLSSPSPPLAASNWPARGMMSPSPWGPPFQSFTLASR